MNACLKGTSIPQLALWYKLITNIPPQAMLWFNEEINSGSKRYLYQLNQFYYIFEQIGLSNKWAFMAARYV